jgi:hypothetical protein
MAGPFSCFSHQTALLNPVTNRVHALISPYVNGGLQKTLEKISNFACEYNAPSPLPCAIILFLKVMRTLRLRFVGLLSHSSLLTLIW